MHKKITRWSVIVAVAGFLFGFDTAVISGADQPIQSLWQTSDLVHGLFIMSSALWGTVLGALFGNLPCEIYGRRKILICIGLLYFVSALGSALAQDPFTFALLRFIGGLGVGISSIVVVMFIFLFIASHAIGQGAVIWVFIAEIFPNHVRTKGQSLGCGTHWVFAALIILLMPTVLSGFDGAGIFAFFAGMMVLQLLVLFLMPETKGKTPESLAENLSSHA